MKCSYCGSRVKKSDEICPNCSKFVSKKNTETQVIQTEISPAEVESATPRHKESDTVFDYKDHILSSLLWSLGFALFFGILLVFPHLTIHIFPLRISIPLFLRSLLSDSPFSSVFQPT